MSTAYYLHLDSRARRADSTVYDARFDLPRPLQNVRRLRVKSVQFVNTFYNLNESNNVLATSAGFVTVTPQQWGGSELVAEINLQLNLLYGTSGVVYVSLDQTTNVLSWTLGSVVTIDATNSTMRQVLGLDAKSYTGPAVFTSQLYLALPQYVAFSSSQLFSSLDNIFPGHGTNDQFQPVCTIPVEVGYLSTQTYQPSYERQQTLSGPGSLGTTISTIDIQVRDPYTRRPITELSHWALILEIN